MKILEIDFSHGVDKWSVQGLKFSIGLNLLVGTSGSGKTRIIKSIAFLRSLAFGHIKDAEVISYLGTKWRLVFADHHNVEWTWTGELCGNESAHSGDILKSEENLKYGKYSFFSEELISASCRIARKGSVFEIDGNQKLPTRLPSSESIFKLFAEDPRVNLVVYMMRQVVSTEALEGTDPSSVECHIIKDIADEVHGLYDGEKEKDSNVNREERLNFYIRHLNFSTLDKIGMAVYFQLESFRRVKQRFIDTFPTVKDIVLVKHEMSPWPEKEVYSLGIIEGDSDVVIPEKRMSSGMRRVLVHFGRMEYWTDGAVILSDEFENSLGVNCLDAIVDSVNENSGRMQFLLTSHHPYVINNFNQGSWIVLTRQNGRIAHFSAKELGLVESSQDAFIKLINYFDRTARKA